MKSFLLLLRLLSISTMWWFPPPTHPHYRRTLLLFLSSVQLSVNRNERQTTSSSPLYRCSRYKGCFLAHATRQFYLKEGRREKYDPVCRSVSHCRVADRRQLQLRWPPRWGRSPTKISTLKDGQRSRTTKKVRSTVLPRLKYPKHDGVFFQRTMLSVVEVS